VLKIGTVILHILKETESWLGAWGNEKDKPRESRGTVTLRCSKWNVGILRRRERQT